MSLLKNIEKRPFQTYKVKDGIDVAFVMVPLEVAAEFEKKVFESEVCGIKSTIQIATQLGGCKIKKTIK